MSVASRSTRKPEPGLQGGARDLAEHGEVPVAVLVVVDGRELERVADEQDAAAPANEVGVDLGRDHGGLVHDHQPGGRGVDLGELQRLRLLGELVERLVQRHRASAGALGDAHGRLARHGRERRGRVESVQELLEDRGLAGSGRARQCHEVRAAARAGPLEDARECGVLVGCQDHIVSPPGIESTRAMRRPIQRITGTAMELPSAALRGPSLAPGIAVQPSGNPCSRSRSSGVSRRTNLPSVTPKSAFLLRAGTTDPEIGSCVI